MSLPDAALECATEDWMQDELESGDFEIRPLAPSDPQASRLVGMPDRLQFSVCPPESAHLDSVETMGHDGATFLAVFAAGEAIGCGTVKHIPPRRTSPRYGEIKRMCAGPVFRGCGLGGALLVALESSLIPHGFVIARLETGIRQLDALALDEGHGHVRIAPFDEHGEDPLSAFCERRLA